MRTLLLVCSSSLIIKVLSEINFEVSFHLLLPALAPPALIVLRALANLMEYLLKSI